jgi:DNA-directed RNA polymerase
LQVLAAIPTDDDDDDDEIPLDNPETDLRDLELWTQQHMSSLSRKRRQTAYPRGEEEQLTGSSLSSLDLELGEGLLWEEDDAANEEEGDDDGLEGVEDWIEEETADVAEALSPSSAASIPSSPPPNSSSRPTAAEMLAGFDPQNPPDTDDPIDLEMWIECHSYQEGLLKYQSVLDSSRQRKDYASLSAFQKQVLQWFPLLRDEIALQQAEYVLKEQQGPTQTSAKRYGPFVCALSPEKLAVITAHETLMLCLLKPGHNGRSGVNFVAIAKRLGEAVEAEVLVHKMLHQRSLSERQRKSERSGAVGEDEGTEDAAELLANIEEEDDTIESDADADVQDPKEASAVVDAAPSHWTYAASHLKNYLEELSRNDLAVKKRRVIRYAIRRARQVLEKDEWSDTDRVGLGAALFQCLLSQATFSVDGQEVPAFIYEKRWVKKVRLQSVVILNDRLHDRIVSDNVGSFAAMTTRYKPMILPPKRWKAPNEGGYLWLKAELMRYHGCRVQEDVLENADLSTLYHGLNYLGSIPWKINRRVLEVAWQCWEQGIPLGDVPSRVDYELPPEPIPLGPISPDLDKESLAYQAAVEERQAVQSNVQKFRRMRQKNMDLRSLRCSAMLKLDQAKTFQEFEKIYFPYNVDFRGRAYPIPPHLSNVGSDLCRGMLTFADAKPLGTRGLFWLKVHLANLAGNNKMTFENRACFVDDNMEQVLLSAQDPFAGETWWMKLDDPFQGLATCIEIKNALDSGDAESYMCSMAVHMDGSCNGLQHYAALGLDSVGGKAVNLCATEDPQDVYVGVMHEVSRRVAEEAERVLDFDTSDVEALTKIQKKELRNSRAAQLVNGLIDRGVVKRTVMTSVYGVTYMGAREQIKEKITPKLQDLGHDVDEMDYEIFNACGYLAATTMEVMGDLFTGAKKSMNWLTTCARMITQHGYPVAWISPIGVPVIQPYRQKKSSTVVTLMQVVTLTDEHDDLPIHKQRQVTAFPPNFVHSLDSSHMLLTALEMDRRGLAFSAVHDSFWTHPCDVDEMNGALRDVFVDLYSRPLLEDLKTSWEMRYPGLEFPDPPAKGTLELKDVKNAPYFFQ